MSGRVSRGGLALGCLLLAIVGAYRPSVAGTLSPISSVAGLDAATGLAIRPRVPSLQQGAALYVKSGATGRAWQIPLDTAGRLGPSRVVTDGLATALDIAFDAAGNLYAPQVDVPVLRRLRADGGVDEAALFGTPAGGIATQGLGLGIDRILFAVNASSLYALRIADYAATDSFSQGEYVGISCGPLQHLTYRPGLRDMLGTTTSEVVSVNIENGDCFPITARTAAPTGVAWDDINGVAYVADAAVGTVTAIGSLGPTTVITGLREPQGLAFDELTGVLFVAERGANRVTGFAAAAPIVPPAPNGLRNLLRPTGLMIRENPHELLIKSGTTGRAWAVTIGVDGGLGTARVVSDQLGSAVDIAFDASRNGYAPQIDASAVRRLRPNGGVDQADLCTRLPAGGIAVESPGLAANFLFFVTRGPSLVRLRLGDYVPTNGFCVGEHVGLTCGLMADLVYRPSLHDIVGITDTDVVSVNRENGTCSAVANDRASTFVHPSGVAWEDGRQVLYIADSGARTVTAIQADGQRVFVSPTRLDGVTGLAFDALTGVLYVAETLGDGVSILLPDSTPTTTSTVPTTTVITTTNTTVRIPTSTSTTRVSVSSTTSTSLPPGEPRIVITAVTPFPRGGSTRDLPVQAESATVRIQLHNVGDTPSPATTNATLGLWVLDVQGQGTLDMIIGPRTNGEALMEGQVYTVRLPALQPLGSTTVDVPYTFLTGVYADILEVHVTVPGVGTNTWRAPFRPAPNPTTFLNCSMELFGIVSRLALAGADRNAVGFLVDFSKLTLVDGARIAGLIRSGRFYEAGNVAFAQFVTFFKDVLKLSGRVVVGALVGLVKDGFNEWNHVGCGEALPDSFRGVWGLVRGAWDAIATYASSIGERFWAWLIGSPIDFTVTGEAGASLVLRADGTIDGTLTEAEGVLVRTRPDIRMAMVLGAGPFQTNYRGTDLGEAHVSAVVPATEEPSRLVEYPPLSVDTRFTAVGTFAADVVGYDLAVDVDGDGVIDRSIPPRVVVDLPASCATAPAVVCDDRDTCTVDSCSSSGSCRHEQEPRCSSNTTTTTSPTTTVPSLCRIDVPGFCDDADACTVDTCDPIAGCRHPEIPTATPSAVSCSLENIAQVVDQPGTPVCRKTCLSKLGRARDKLKDRLAALGGVAPEAKGCRRRARQLVRAAAMLSKVSRKKADGIPVASAASVLRREADRLPAHAKAVAMASCR